MSAVQISEKKIRVIQWSTGNIGTHALRAILQHPEMELVGLWVHGADKVGQDAGVLAGLSPCGVHACSDADSLLALDADVVCYCSGADSRLFDAIDDFVKILRSGKNIVSTSLPFLTYPPQADKNLRHPIESACRDAGVSCFVSGIDPGFGNDLIPLTLLSVCEKVEKIRIAEILNYATYNQPHTLFDIMGFGKPMDEVPLLLLPGALTFAWGGVIQMMADATGAQLDEIREVYERLPAPDDINIELGVILKGTVAALRFEVQGIINGKPAIIVEHVTRLHDDLAPHWPQGQGSGSYRIEITGSPTMAMDFHLTGADGDHNTGGLLASAMRIVHAIPAVVHAPPGLLSTLDFVPVNGRHVFTQ
jgi:4-hydroxy-tetrahydrodipicolinate reductase